MPIVLLPLRWAHLIALLLLFTLSSVSVSAAMVQTNSLGKLTGARGVLVSGNLYDVSFVDGTFNEVFVDAPGLTATNASEAETFSRALRSQVFLDGPLGAEDDYDSDISLTKGCSGTGSFDACGIITPYGFAKHSSSDVVTVATFANFNGAQVDIISSHHEGG